MRTESTAESWALVEREKRRDRTLRRVSIVAWTVTFLLVAIFAVIIALRVSETLKLAAVGAVSRQLAIQAAIPLILVLGELSLLVAVLATVGVFLRFRTASLAEIQLRLAALEGMVAGAGDR